MNFKTKEYIILGVALASAVLFLLASLWHAKQVLA